MLSTKTQDLTIHRNHLNAQNIVCSQAIFQTVDTTRIFSDIATNGTGNLTGRLVA